MQPQEPAAQTARPVRPDAEFRKRRVRRRRLVKTAAIVIAGAAAASGYVQPSVTPLQSPVASAFSF